MLRFSGCLGMPNKRTEEVDMDDRDSALIWR